MILLSGIPTESPLAFLAEALDERGAEYRFFNRRRSATAPLNWTSAQRARRVSSA